MHKGKAYCSAVLFLHSLNHVLQSDFASWVMDTRHDARYYMDYLDYMNWAQKQV